MRLPRVQFSVRRLMAIVAVAAFLWWLILESEKDTGSTRGVGYVGVPLDFVVTEADSGRAIEGAVIHLRDFDFQSTPKPPEFLELKTESNGHATTVVHVMFYVSHGIPSNRLLGYRVVYPNWEMKVSAEGFQDFVVCFSEYEGRDRRFHQKTPPPPIEIRLRR